MFVTLDNEAKMPANGNPLNCTMDPDTPWNALACPELEIDQNKQALHPAVQYVTHHCPTKLPNLESFPKFDQTEKSLERDLYSPSCD